MGLQCHPSLCPCRFQPTLKNRMDLDVVNMFVIAGGTLAIPILAFVASFLLWPSALIRIYYWWVHFTSGLLNSILIWSSSQLALSVIAIWHFTMGDFKHTESWNLGDVLEEWARAAHGQVRSVWSLMVPLPLRTPSFLQPPILSADRNSACVWECLWHFCDHWILTQWGHEGWCHWKRNDRHQDHCEWLV